MAMNKWPMQADFSMAMQNPRFAFKDPELQKLEIVRTPNRQPRPWSGAFAVVFKGIFPSSKQAIAVRVFTSDVPERLQRYQTLCSHLDKVQIKSLVKFSYDPQGICIANGTYPLIRMDWVEGQTLFEWVQEKAAQGDKNAFQRIAAKWFDLVGELQAASLAHGDLQHANVMVTAQGELKLVDYDCMYVPSMPKGWKNTEIGVKPYQHPSRNIDTLLSPQLDHFSAIFIWLVLRALAIDTSLWQRFIKRSGDVEDYDKLLIREEDILDPTNSLLMAELRKSRDAEVVELTAALLNFAKQPIHEVPALDEAINPYRKLDHALQQKNWDDAFTLFSGYNTTRKSKLPSNLISAVRLAETKVNSKQSLQQALKSNDINVINRILASNALADYQTAAPLLTEAKQLVLVQQEVTKIVEALKLSQLRQAVQLWDAQKKLLDSHVLSKPYASQIDQARQANQFVDDIQVQLKSPDPDGDRLKQMWAKLRSVGSHPEISAAIQQLIINLVERQDAWNRLAVIADASTQTSDHELERAWDEKRFQGWARAERFRHRIDTARQRLSDFKKCEAFLRSPANDRNQEAEVLVQLNRLPRDYDPQLQRRAQLANDRLKTLRDLEAALTSNDSDLEIDNLFSQLKKLEAEHLLSAELGSRANLARQRKPVLDKLQQLRTLALPPHHFDEKLVLFCRQHHSILENSPEFAEWQERVQSATQRYLAHQALRQAIEQAESQYPKLEASLEKSIADISKKLPPDYSDLQTRVKLATNRLDCLDKHRQLANNQDERVLAKLLQYYKKVQGIALLDAANLQRLQLASHRAPLVQKLADLPKEATVARDDLLLAIWDDKLLSHCEQVKNYRLEWQRATNRRKYLAHLAARQLDDFQIVDGAKSSDFKSFAFANEVAETVKAAELRVKDANVILAALKESNVQMFLDHFDTTTIQRYPAKFSQYKPLLEKLITQHLYQAAKIELKLPDFGDAILNESRGYRLRWDWPVPRITRTCLLGITPLLVLPNTSPDKASLISKQELALDAFQNNMGAFIPYSELTRGNYAVVWAIIDVGFTRYYSEALIVGPLEDLQTPDAGFSRW